MNELKPCPFCPDGKFEDVLFYDGVFYAHCDKCGITIQGEGADESEFIEHLNNRPLEEALQKRLEKETKWKEKYLNESIDCNLALADVLSCIQKARDEIGMQFTSCEYTALYRESLGEVLDILRKHLTGIGGNDG